MLPVAIDARPHGATEGSFRPAADPGLRIRRDIRGKDRAERRRHRKAAGKALAAAHRMTIRAVSDRREVATAFDERSTERLRRWRIDRRDRRPPRDCKGRNRAANQERCNGASDNPWLRHPSLQLFGAVASTIPRLALAEATVPQIAASTRHGLQGNVEAIRSKGTGPFAG